MPVPIEAIQSQLLLNRHRRGDRDALAELVTLWERPLLYYLRRLLDSEEDAWDALQETWLLAVRELPRLRDDRAFPAWAYTIARRVAMRARRRRRPVEELPEDDMAGAPFVGDEEPAFAGYGALDLHRGLAALSLAHREVLTLHFLEGFSVTEIGAIVGASAGTVKSRLHYARRALKSRLEGGTS